MTYIINKSRTQYNVITTIERIPFEIDSDMSIFERTKLRLTNRTQRETFALVVKFFADAYGEWKFLARYVREENEFKFCYEANSFSDAQREMDKIKTEAFQAIGTKQIKILKKRFNLKKVEDENPQFEKLTNNLASMGIFLEVKIIFDD